MTSLSIATDLQLPLDTVTQAVAILAKRRAGKSYLARRFAEQLHVAGQQIVVVDPKGDWWGARSAADGKSPGMPIVILGGDHGDLPLEPDSGAVVAKLVVEERVSVLLDLSLLRKHEVATFMAAFLEELYRMKARAEYRTPLMLFVDEADAIAPQKPQPNEMRMLGAMNDVVRRGGQRGLGCCVITQRSAVLSKDVLTQVQVLITLRTMSPQDLAAIKAWIDVHGTLEQQKVLMASLPSLPIGDAWFWSPGWPTDAGIFQRSHVLPIATFDSGSTPKAGETAAVPKRLAEVDLEAVRRQMADSIAKAQENDPKALRTRIKELEAQVSAPGTTVSAAACDELASHALQLQAVHSNVLTDTVGVVMDVQEMCRKLHTMLDTLKSSVDSDPTVLSIRGLQNNKKFWETFQPPPLPESATLQAAVTKARRLTPAQVLGISTRTAPASDLEKVDRLMLQVLHIHGRMTLARCAMLAGYPVTASTTRNAASRLRSAGLIDGDNSDMGVTTLGTTKTGPIEKLPKGPQQLLEYWCGRLEKVDGEMLRVLAKRYPTPLMYNDLAKAAGYEPEKSTARNAASRLRGLGLVEGANTKGILIRKELAK